MKSIKEKFKKSVGDFWNRHQMRLIKFSFFGWFLSLINFFINHTLEAKLWVILAFSIMFLLTFIHIWQIKGWLLKEIWDAAGKKDYETMNAAIECAAPFGFDRMVGKMRKRAKEKGGADKK